MKNPELWDRLKSAKENLEWIELSNTVSGDTPHWDGFPAMRQRLIYDFDPDGFRAFEYTIVGQFGTHVDAPVHFCPGQVTLDAFGPRDMVYPLCVLDRTEACRENSDYQLTVEDVLNWENQYGKIPAGAFAALRSGWSRRATGREMDNCDAAGQKHYPGWSLEALQFLTEERKIGAIGHETSDTDSAVTAEPSHYACETYILSTGRLQVELLKNLDRVPPVGAVIFVTFLKMKGGSGFPARCFAVVPRESPEAVC
jgi:kynurenine formamidase